MTHDLQLPPEFDIPPSRLLRRREHLSDALMRGGSRASGLRTRRGWALALAGAGCAAIAAGPVIDLVDSDGSHRGVVDKAVAAVTSEESVHHVVELITVRYETKDPRVLEAFDLENVDLFEDVTQYSESWSGPGERTHLLLYEADGGRRGRLLHESSWDGLAGSQFDARTNTVSIFRARRGPRPRTLRPHGITPPDIDPRQDLRVQLRRLHEQGRLRLAGTKEVRGRNAHRLVSDTWVDPSEKGHTERVEFLVDTDTYLPLEQRNVSTQLGVSGLPKELRPAPEMYETEVTSKSTRTFLSYETLPPTAENLAKLKPRRHPGAKVFGPGPPRR